MYDFFANIINRYIVLWIKYRNTAKHVPRYQPNQLYDIIPIYVPRAFEGT